LKSGKSDTISLRTVLNVVGCLFISLCLLSILSCFESAPTEEEVEKALAPLEMSEYSRVIEVLEFLIPKIKDPETRGRCNYVAATCYRELGDWDKAISYYQLALEEEEFLFADLASLHIATGYRSLYNYGDAIKWYESILLNHPESYTAVEARYQLAECYFTMKDYEAAIGHYVKFIEDYPEDERIRVVKYRTGCAYQELEKWSEAYIQYQGLIRQDMKDDVARNALDRIKFLLSSHSDITVTTDDRMNYGLVLYYARKYKDAREELKKVVDDTDNSSAKAAYFIADSYYQERKYTTAIKEYTAFAKRYPESNYAVSSQYYTALCRWKTAQRELSNTLLAKFAETYPDSYFADNARFQIADNHRSRGKYKEAADAYSKVVVEYPTSALADDSLWNMSRCYEKLGDKDNNQQALRRLLNEYPDSSLTGSARFWIGMNHEKAEEWEAATGAYKEAMANRDWYYADRAKRRIDSLVKREKITKEAGTVQYEKVKLDDSIPAWQNIQAPIPTRAQELLNLRIFDDAVGELRMLVKTAVALEGAYYNISACYKKMGDFNNSWRYAWRLSRLPNMKGEDEVMPRQLHRMLYPLAFWEAISTNAEKNELDPFLMLALMYEESRYSPTAFSSAGAHGLTQIMPPTGRDIARRLKIQPFSNEMLFQPETNIRMGTWYLGDAVKRLSRDMGKILEKNAPGKEFDLNDIVKILALGAYNGGESRVRRWVNEYGIEDMDEFVEKIPIDQTRRYIKKVCHTYEMYKFLYGQSLTPKSDDIS